MLQTTTDGEHDLRAVEHDLRAGEHDLRAGEDALSFAWPEQLLHEGGYFCSQTL